MLKITLENGSAYEVLSDTACYPSMIYHDAQLS